MEIWKVIKEYPAYEVSNLGRVRSLPRHAFTRDYGGIIKKQSNSYNGYLRTALFDNGKRQMKFVHRLVADAFLPNPDPSIYTQINHINEDKTDNRVSNLEWCTPQYNSSFGTRPDRLSKLHLDNCWNGKKCYLYKDGILINTFPSVAQAAKYLGVSSTQARRCYRGERKTFAGYKFSPIQLPH